MNRIDRRQFLTLVSAASLHPAIGSSEHTRSRPVVQEFKVALPIPTILSPVRRDATADYYALEQRESSVEIIPGVRTRIWGYGGSFPGPTIEARRGRVYRRDSYQQSQRAHCRSSARRSHAARFGWIPDGHAGSGGVAQPSVRQHGAGCITVVSRSWLAREWAQSYMGLAGFYLLKDDAEVHARLPHGDHDIPLMLQDRAFSSDGELDYDHDGHHGAIGRVMLVNGAPWPVLDVAARKYRFRILNASNAMPIRLALSTDQPMTQIATDQGLLRRRSCCRRLD